MATPRITAKPLDNMVKDQFAAALELAFAQAVVDPLPPGHISLEEKERGGLYAKWRRQGADSKPASPIYLGPVDSEPHLAALAHKADLDRIERTAKNLRKLGIATEDNASAIVLAALANAGFFSGGGILVGTRAFRCLANHLGYAVTPVLATQDVDVARLNTIRLASTFPTGGMLALLKATGMCFVDVPSLNRREHSTSWRVIGKEIKLDLLVPAKGKIKPYSNVAVPELGAHATALEHLDYLLQESIEAVVIGKSQLIPVRVPAPAHFCWHKLAVSQLRPTTFKVKSEKDLAQAACLAMCLLVDDSDALHEASIAMSRAMRTLVKQSLPGFAVLLGSKHDDLVITLKKMLEKT